MKRNILLVLILVGFLFAQESTGNTPIDTTGASAPVETCSASSMPIEACATVGYICNLGFNVAGERSMLFFNLGGDSLCIPPLFKSNFVTYVDTSGTQNVPAHTTFFLVEDENEATPLSLTLAGSIAMTASINRQKVYIIYKKVKDQDFGGIRLLSIEFYNH